MKMACRNRSEKPLHIKRFIVVDAVRPGSWEGGFALNFDIPNSRGAMNPMDCGITLFEEGFELGGVYATATNRPAFTGAFISTSHYEGIVNVKPFSGGLKIMAINPADGVLLSPGAERESEPVWMSPGRHPSVELERWGDLSGRWNHVRFWERPFATLCTWYSDLISPTSHCNGVLERTILASLPTLAEKFRPFGLECIRVVNNHDSRLQGDWPFITDSIPGGYPALNGAMRAYGFMPGFWADIFALCVDSKTYAQHPEWVAVGPDGKPVLGRGVLHKSGPCGILDSSVDGARDHYYQTARRFREAGMQYHFMEGASNSAIGPLSGFRRSHNPAMTAIEVSRRTMEALREGFGEDFYLLVQAQLLNAGYIGVADAIRTGWDSFGHNLVTYRQGMSKWFMNRRVILCDPDAWVPLSHDFQWDRNWGSWQGLSGYAMTLGLPIKRWVDSPGELAGLTPEREEIIQRILPPLASTGRPRDIWEREWPMVIEQSLAVGDEQWRVVGLFNYHQVPLRVQLNLDRLWDESIFDEQGFPGDSAKLGTTDQRYLVYDFWPEKFLGEYGGTAEFELDALGGKVLTVRLATDRPQILAVGNHIGQGILELKDSSWDSESRTLRLITQGRADMIDTAVRLRVPPGWKIISATAEGKTLNGSCPQDEVCLITIPDHQKEVKCQIMFEGSLKGGKPGVRPVESGLIAVTRLNADAEKLQENLPKIIEEMIDARKRRDKIPESYKIVFYATPQQQAPQDESVASVLPGINILGESYMPELGFGLVKGQARSFRNNNPFGRYELWNHPELVAYRVDGLSPSETYRLGVNLFIPGKTEVDIAVVRAHDGQEFVLAHGVEVAPKMNNKVCWYDLPRDAVDSSGLIIEVRNRGKLSPVACNEFWIARPANSPSKALLESD